MSETGKADHIVLETSGAVWGRHIEDIPLPVPSFDGRSLVPPSPPTVKQQSELERLQDELHAAQAELDALVKAEKEQKK